MTPATKLCQTANEKQVMVNCSPMHLTVTPIVTTGYQTRLNDWQSYTWHRYVRARGLWPVVVDMSAEAALSKITPEKRGWTLAPMAFY